MNKFIIQISNTTNGIANGTKAKELSLLQNIGIAVPEFYTIPVYEYHRFIKYFNIPSISDFLNEKYDSSIANKINNLIDYVAIDVPIDFESDYIARSSSVPNKINEQYASIISGAFESYHCKGKELIKNILKVYSSMYSYEVYERMQLFDGIDVIDGMAVIIQRYISPKCSGVLHFYKDSNRMDVTWIAGHLRDIVSGNEIGCCDTLFVEDDEVIIEGDEWHIYTIMNNNFNGAFNELYRVASSIGDIYKCNLEIEWIFDGLKIFIVQAQELIVL